VIVRIDYRGHHIRVTAVHEDGAWDAEVRIDLTLSEGTSHVAVVPCRTATAKAAEEGGALYALRWVDRNATDARHQGGGS
jgi:hypothetical protein